MSLSGDRNRLFDRRQRHNREDAGLRLGRALERYQNQNGLVYALPGESIILGYRIAKFLSLPMTLMPVLEIYHPFNHRHVIGAVAEDGHRIINNADEVFIGPDQIETKVYEARNKAKMCRSTYLQGRRMGNPRGKIAFLVIEDFLSDSSIMLAIDELCHFDPEKIVVAMSLAPYSFVQKIKDSLVECVALEMPPYCAGTRDYNDAGYSLAESEIIRMFEDTKAPR